MPYGELRVDTITFTNGGVDKSITVSGLFASTSGNLTVTGTVSGNTANFVSGVFTTQISGTTITGTTVAATTGTFTTVTGGVATITSGVFAVGSAAAPSISFSSDSNTGIYSPGGDQVAISTNGIGRLFVNSSGNLLLGTATDGSFNRNIVLEGTSSAGVMFRAGGAFKGFFYVDTSNAVLGASTGDIILKPADTERLRITSAGLVGIGTSSVSRTLDVVSTDTWIRTARTGGNAWIVGTGVQDAYRIYDDTAGVERFRIDTSGRVGIGTTSPSETLHVVGTAQASQFKSAGGAGATGYDFSASGSGAGVANIFCPSGFTLGFGTNSLERARIDSSGRLLVGTSTARTGFFNTTINNAFVQVETTSQELIGYTAVVNSNTQYGPVMLLGKSRGATTNSATAVSNGDTLGLLSFQGADGSQLVEGASIAAYVDGTPGADDLPTRLVLSTTADGASSPTERMRIDSSGRVGIGTSPDSRLHVVDSSGNSIRIGYLPGTNNFNIYDAGAHLFRSSGGITEYARIDTSGRLGVGTSSPSTKLQIGASSADGVTIDFNGGIATGSEYTNLRFTASAYGFVGAEIRGIHTNGGTNLGVLAFHTSGSERLRITSAGLVGVGTSAPTVRLQVQDSIAGGSDGTVATLHNFSDAGGDARYVGLNFRIGSDNGTSAIRAARTLSAADYRTELSFWTNPTGATQTPVRAMTIDYLQRVGIGTTSPGALLHLAQSAADAVARIDGGSSSTAFIDFRIAGANKSYVGLGGLTGGSNNDLINYNSSAGNWIAYTNGSERLRITSAGLVGIGVSSVGAQLDVYNSQASGISEVARLRWNNGGTGGALTYANQSGTVLGQIANVTSASGVELAFSTYNNSTALGERMRLTSTGLGIGSTGPSDSQSFGNALDLRGSTGAAYYSATSDNTTRAYFATFTGGGYIGTETNHPLIIRTNNAEKARLDTSGRLLVGTSSSRGPGDHQGRLQVEGTGYASSTAAIIANSNDAFGSYLFLGKSRGTSVGSNTVVASGDLLGEVRFLGTDGTGLITGARIEAFVDGTPGANDMPGRIVLSTTADGTSSPTERMRIGQDGTSRIFASNYGLVIGNGQTAGTTYTAFEVYSGATSTTSLGTLGLHILNNGNVQNTNNSYGSFSDIKLKENIVDATSQWSDIKALQVRKYNFKEGQTHTQIGLVAQEVELVSPGLVSESPDRDAEGNDLGTVTKSVNYSVLYMKAVKALQEAMLRIEDLEARLDAANL